MSDPKSTYGEPVEEPRGVDDVVGRANEGLAEAEAARRDAVTDAELAAAEPIDAPGTSGSAEGPAARDAAGTPAADPDPWDSPEAAALEYDKTVPVASTAEHASTVEHASTADGAPTVVDAPVVTASEPVAAEPVVSGTPATVTPISGTPASGTPATETTTAATGATAAWGPQPIFVQAPEAPHPRGNRAAAGAIGLLAALSFAVLYLAAWLGFGLLAGDVTGENVGTVALEALTTWSLWVPVVVFFVAFWLLGAIINRGRWGAWVIFGLLVGVAAYAGHVLGALFQAPFWMLTASEGAAVVEEELLAPLAIAAFVIGRELTIWFGAWTAARGKRVTELNVEAQREYERTLEAGPQLVRP